MIRNVARLNTGFVSRSRNARLSRVMLKRTFLVSPGLR